MKKIKDAKIDITAIPLKKGELWRYIQNLNKMNHLIQLYRNILYFICVYSVKSSPPPISPLQSGMQLPAKACVFTSHISSTFFQKPVQRETFMISNKAAILFILRSSEPKLHAGRKIKHQTIKAAREVMYKHNQKSLQLNV